MEAMVYSKRSAPRGMRLTEVEKPVPTAGQVLVKIHSVSLNAADYRSMQMGIGPKSGIFGADIAGLVEAVGQDTMKFKVGDAVFGELSINDFGGLAEYVAALRHFWQRSSTQCPSNMPPPYRWPQSQRSRDFAKKAEFVRLSTDATHSLNPGKPLIT
ncbi:MAG TPA: alcohol dehydrogenase catalytic domain-containing protein [Clostridiaceae bacterium]|nr:alcohol dehydrogenase catalytic domain-containing protein [Clostridiaceae bacterium]